jgi:RNA polymerase sigma-70 factor, ECF subfamily
MSSPPPQLRIVPPAETEDVDNVFRLHAPYVAGVAMRLLGRDDEVQDVVQETFLAALTRIAQLREPEAIRGWLATIAVRLASRRLRARRIRAFFGLDAQRELDSLVSNDASPEHRALLRGIYAQLDELPVAQRVAWVLRHVEGEPLERVAQLCRCSLATAKRRITAAHEVLQAEVADA